MGAFKKIAAAAGLLAAAGVGETLYFYNRTMKRGNAKTERTTKMSGTDWEQYFPLMESRKGFVMAQPHRDVYITSFDGLKLHATFFPAMTCPKDAEKDRSQPGTVENAESPKVPSEQTEETDRLEEANLSEQATRPGQMRLSEGQIYKNVKTDSEIGTDCSGIKKAVICFHGYTGEGLSNHIAIADYFLKHGYAILLPDARAHGESEGEYIGFGCLDRRDALDWIHWLIRECGDDINIMLHGTSMGGATVLMTSGLLLPANVRGIVSDCGFTSPKEVFTYVLKTMYHLPAFPAIQGADILNKKLAGYGMDECNAREEVRKAKVPILFIHGSADTFVPCSMCHEIYDNCASPKRKLIVEGAAHAESYYKDMAAYEKALDAFAEEIMAEKTSSQTRDAGV